MSDSDLAQQQAALEAAEAALPKLARKHAQAFDKQIRFVKKRIAQSLPVDRKLSKLVDDVQHAVTAIEQKYAQIPNPEYPQELPVSERHDEILEAIREHQVVIIAGETGSGKTTQIPKMCLELGLGVRGLIGHTQPRRIAARTVASRIAEELKVQVGALVGYQVRFQDHSDERTAIKLMTDGILLAEIQHDPKLLAYDCIIIDEAHERSLNIDFLLGYLKQLLPQRPDLKLIVTSATIDVQRFSEHFGGAPIIEVSGRTYPVETRYRPWHEEFEDINEAVVAALEEIVQESKGQGGDVLVFVSGERDIRAVSLAIKKSNLAGLDVLPLYARLSLAEQNRVFQPSRSRKVVLATNVAETSITVPGIRYVIDTGYARISRYSLRTKVQRLPIEAISQASANQRQGRCGRVSNGICYRLYSEEDFLARPEFTDPELLRTNLAAVVLQMLQLKMGKVEDFPFVDKPDSRLINDGYRLLEELQAVRADGSITTVGRSLSKLSVDPKFARMVLDAAKLGCLNEILIIVTALTLQDPRERPVEKQQAADEKHRRFFDEKSDFIAYVNLWYYIEEQRQELSQNQFRKLCKREFLNFVRLKEWRELHHQLKLQTKELGFSLNSAPANFDLVHKALLSGLLSNVARRDEEDGSREYIGTRSRKCLVFPGSGLRKKKYNWLVAADFIETSQVFAHCVAKIDPVWVIDLAGHVVKHHYSEPHYDAKSGAVKAYDKISLWGLVLAEKKRVDYGRIDGRLSREVFIREALVEEKYRGKAEFFHHNRKVIAEVKVLESKARRRDILVDDEKLYAFYDTRLPEKLYNQAGLEHYVKKAPEQETQTLKLTPEDIMLHSASNVSEAQFPDAIKNGDYYFSVKYEFEPTRKNDGLNVSVPVDLLHQVKENELEWLVPGLLHDKCCALIKTLPKQKRKHFVPVPAFVDRALTKMQNREQPLVDALIEQARNFLNLDLKQEEWRPELLESFYQANVVVVDERNKIIDQGRDLNVLRQRYKAKVKSTLESIGNDIEREGIEKWDFSDFPESVELKRGSVKVKAFPSLVANRGKKSVDLRLYDNPIEAQVLSSRGLCQLALNEMRATARHINKDLLKGKDIGLSLVKMGSRDEVVGEIMLAAIRRACFGDAVISEARSHTEFEQKLEAGKADFADKCFEYEALLTEALSKLLVIRKKIKSTKNALAMALCFGDVQTQIDRFFQPGILFSEPWEWLQHLPRYLDAAVLRMDKAAQRLQADRVATLQIQDLEKMHFDRLEKLGPFVYQSDAGWQEYRWLLEELRVSLFAQTLKTRVPVSEKRLKKVFNEL